MKILVCLLIAALLTGPPVAAQQSEEECLVTRPNDGSFYSNAALRASIGIGSGRLVFEPGGPGFIDYDGALGIKFAFVRLIPGRLFVSGRRLDGEAGPARAYIYDYGSEGFQPIYLVFPTPGCWEITGRVAGESSTFVLLVEKIGGGPSWLMDGPPESRRVTTIRQDL